LPYGHSELTGTPVLFSGSKIRGKSSSGDLFLKIQCDDGKQRILEVIDDSDDFGVSVSMINIQVDIGTRISFIKGNYFWEIHHYFNHRFIYLNYPDTSINSPLDISLVSDYPYMNSYFDNDRLVGKKRAGYITVIGKSEVESPN